MQQLLLDCIVKVSAHQCTLFPLLLSPLNLLLDTNKLWLDLEPKPTRLDDVLGDLREALLTLVQQEVGPELRDR